MQRSKRFYPGQIVTLYPHIVHEGPHPDDFDAQPRYAIVMHVHRHPNNAMMIRSYDVIELLDADPSHHAHVIDRINVRSIARGPVDAPSDVVARLCRAKAHA